MSAVLLDYPHRKGGHCGSGAIRDLLDWAGLGWGGSPSEGLVFALSGAMDFAYIRSSDLRPPVYLVGRGGDLEVDLPRRLGAEVEVLSTDDPAEGWDVVRREIDSGRPVMVWADIAELPYLRVRLRMSRHDIVIIGYDDSSRVAYVVDNDREEVQEVPYDALERARSSMSFPEPTRHTSYLIEWPERLPNLGLIAGAAFSQASKSMVAGSSPPIAAPEGGVVSGTGLDGVAVFANDIAEWADTFDGAQLDHVLMGLGAFIEKAGTGGGLFRKLLAEGCTVIADTTGNPAVSRAGSAAAKAAAGWAELATAATGRGYDNPNVHERFARACRRAAKLPELEGALVEALKVAAESEGT